MLEEFYNQELYIKITKHDDLSRLDELNLKWLSGHNFNDEFTYNMIRDKDIYIVWRTKGCAYTRYKPACWVTFDEFVEAIHTQTIDESDITHLLEEV